MGRVINPDNPGKRRNYHMRTAAELMRHLSQKQAIDSDAKDMLALLVFTLKDIADGIDESTVAWEKRNYWIKIEEFRRNWNWTIEIANDLESMVINDNWQHLPAMMVKLFPHLSEIKVTKFTRKETLWQGCYVKLIEEYDLIK